MLSPHIVYTALLLRTKMHGNCFGVVGTILILNSKGNRKLKMYIKYV